jgi:hypothetical protein
MSAFIIASVMGRVTVNLVPFPIVVSMSIRPDSFETFS